MTSASKVPLSKVTRAAHWRTLPNVRHRGRALLSIDSRNSSSRVNGVSPSALIAPEPSLPRPWGQDVLAALLSMKPVWGIRGAG